MLGRRNAIHISPQQNAALITGHCSRSHAQWNTYIEVGVVQVYQVPLSAYHSSQQQTAQ